MHCRLNNLKCHAILLSSLLSTNIVQHFTQGDWHLSQPSRHIHHQQNRSWYFMIVQKSLLVIFSCFPKLSAYRLIRDSILEKRCKCSVRWWPPHPRADLRGSLAASAVALRPQVQVSSRRHRSDGLVTGQSILSFFATFSIFRFWHVHVCLTKTAFL